MKKIITIGILLTLFLSCRQTMTNDKKQTQTFTLKKVKIGTFSFRVPSHYNVLYNDTVNTPGVGYLVSNCAKMYFNTDVIGSGKILSKDKYEGYTVLQDTVNGFLKMVAYKYDSIPHLQVHVAKLEKFDASLIFGNDNSLSNWNCIYVFNAMTGMGYGQPTCMTKDEMDVLVKEFMKGTIEN